jgi:hypothetical protein
MYLLIKIIVNAVVIFFPAVLLYRDLKHHDRRTRYHRQITHALLLGWIVAGLATIGITWNDYSSTIRSDERITELIQGKDTLVAQNNTLMMQNKELMVQVNTYQVDLEQEKTKTKKLQESAKKAARGDTFSYMFNGETLTRQGVITSMSEGSETSIVFVELLRLDDERKYIALLSKSIEQISKTPEWLTPYLFRGIAQANMGKESEAIASFEYVIKNAPDDPDYQRARVFIEKLKKK